MTEPFFFSCSNCSSLFAAFLSYLFVCFFWYLRPHKILRTAFIFIMKNDFFYEFFPLPRDGVPNTVKTSKTIKQITFFFFFLRRFQTKYHAPSIFVAKIFLNKMSYNVHTLYAYIISVFTSSSFPPSILLFSYRYYSRLFINLLHIQFASYLNQRLCSSQKNSC